MNAREVIEEIRSDPVLAEEARRLFMSEALLRLPEVMAELAERQAATEARMAELTQRMAELAERQAATEARMAELAERQAATEARMAELAERQAATEARMDQLVERMDQLAHRIAQLTERVDKLTGKVDNMRGDLLELRYERHAAAYFSSKLGRVRVLAGEALVDLVEDARDAGTLSPAEADDLLLADLVVEGLDRSTRQRRRLVVEVSGLVEVQDVERAARRAALLARADLSLGVEAAAVGEGIEAEAVPLATQRQVAIFLDGRRG